MTTAKDGIVERNIRTVCDQARTLLYHTVDWRPAAITVYDRTTALCPENDYGHKQRHSRAIMGSLLRKYSVNNSVYPTG
jgi:hypothetical protein